LGFDASSTVAASEASATMLPASFGAGSSLLGDVVEGGVPVVSSSAFALSPSTPLPASVAVPLGFEC
jgi:hypothetical protein